MKSGKQVVLRNLQRGGLITIIPWSSKCGVPTWTCSSSWTHTHASCTSPLTWWRVKGPWVNCSKKLWKRAEAKIWNLNWESWDQLSPVIEKLVPRGLPTGSFLYHWRGPIEKLFLSTLRQKTNVCPCLNSPLQFCIYPPFPPSPPNLVLYCRFRTLVKSLYVSECIHISFVKCLWVSWKTQ